MLSFFRVNDPYRLVPLSIIFVIIRVVQTHFISGEDFVLEIKWLLLGEWLNNGYKMYSETFDYTGPLAYVIYKYLNLFFGKSDFLFHLLSTLLIIIQAGIFNLTFIVNKVYKENGYVPAFLYIMLMIAIPDFMTLSPQLMSLTFLLLTFRSVLRRINNQTTDELFLKSGIYMGIATMIFFPAVIFFIVFLLSLIIFSSAIFRRLVLYFLGFLLVFFLCSLYYYTQGILVIYYKSFITYSLSLPIRSFLTSRELLEFLLPFLIIAFLSIIKTLWSAKLTSFQSKVQQVVWLMLFVSIIIFFISPENAGLEMVFFVPSLSYFWTHYFILLKRKFWKWIMSPLMIGGMIFLSINNYQEKTTPLQVRKNQSVDKDVMILSDDMSYYHKQTMGTPCFNMYIFEKRMEDLKYYNNSSKIFELFYKIDASTIIDKTGTMSILLQRFPQMRNKYVQINENTYQKIPSN